MGYKPLSSKKMDTITISMFEYFDRKTFGFFLLKNSNYAGEGPLGTKQ